MPPTCTICRHPDGEAIDQAVIAGTPLRTIADRWSVSKTALIRHRPHISAMLTKARAAKEATHADTATKIDGRGMIGELADNLPSSRRGVLP